MTSNVSHVASTETNVSSNLLQEMLSKPWDVKPNFAPILVSMASVIIVCGLISNFLLMISIWRTPKLHTTTNTIVVFMCMLDLWRIFHILSFDFVSGVSGKWQYSKDGPCIYSSLMSTLMGKATGFSLCAISINRMVMITRHSVYRKVFSPKNTAAILISILVISLATSLPVALEGTNIYNLYSDQTGSCFPYDANPLKVFELSSIFMAIILPSLVMVPCYSWIYYYVRRSKRRVAAHDTQGVAMTTSFKDEIRSALIIFLAYITYFVFYIPLYSSYVAYVMGAEIPDEVLVVSSYLTDLYRFIRPSLYPLLGNTYRNALFRLFRPAGQPESSDNTTGTLSTDKTPTNITLVKPLPSTTQLHPRG